MNTILLILASQVTIHAAPGDVEARLIVRAVQCDLRVVDEDSAAIAEYQRELRKIVKVKMAVDTFVEIGRTKSRVPLTALDSPYLTILYLKRCCDQHNARHRTYAETTQNHESALYAGMIDLGSEATEADELPLPWRAEYAWTLFRPPEIEK